MGWRFQFGLEPVFLFYLDSSRLHVATGGLFSLCVWPRHGRMKGTPWFYLGPCDGCLELRAGEFLATLWTGRRVRAEAI
jgi:hypothetical protein